MASRHATPQGFFQIFKVPPLFQVSLEKGFHQDFFCPNLFDEFYSGCFSAQVPENSNPASLKVFILHGEFKAGAGFPDCNRKAEGVAGFVVFGEGIFPGNFYAVKIRPPGIISKGCCREAPLLLLTMP